MSVLNLLLSKQVYRFVHLKWKVDCCCFCLTHAWKCATFEDASLGESWSQAFEPVYFQKSVSIASWLHLPVFLFDFNLIMELKPASIICLIRIWGCFISTEIAWMSIHAAVKRFSPLPFSWEVLKTSMKPHPAGVLWTEFLPWGSVLKVLIMKRDMIGSGWDVIVWGKFCNFVLSRGDFLLQQAVNARQMNRLGWFRLNRAGKAFWIDFWLTIKVHFEGWLLLTMLSWHKYFCRTSES